MDKINRVLFIGSKKLGLSCLKTIYGLDPGSLAGIMTFDDRNDTRCMLNGFKAFAQKIGKDFFVAKEKEDSERIIKKLKPQLCIIVGWYWLIGKDALASVSEGLIGIHNSLLPKYRGGSPLIWALINGEKEVGLSLFSLTTGVDDGDIWGQGKFKVNIGDYISDILKKLETSAVSLLKEKYLNIINRRIVPVAQDHSQATFCAQRFPEDGDIDWKEPADKIYDFIRFQAEPYPGAFTYYNGQKMIIHKAHLSNIICYGSAGQVAKIDKDGVYIVCGNNKPIVLDVVQLEQLKKESANKIIKSIKTRFLNLSGKTTILRSEKCK